MPQSLSDSLPDTETLLVAGGDARIAPDALTGLNRYGCRPHPDPDVLSFASSTATSISPAGFLAADALRVRLLAGGADEIAIQMRRIRRELLDVAALPATELLFAASGTDAHHLAAQCALQRASGPLTVVMVEEGETGSGVAAALRSAGDAVQLRRVPLRGADGEPRQVQEVDRDVENWVRCANRALLIMVDQSKTGLVAPSPACVARLHDEHRDRLDVLVDACQFRIGASTLNAYLKQGFWVALTGSKFMTGPSFSAALLLPGKVCALPGSDAGGMEQAAQLLRWEAALVEMRRFNALPKDEVCRCLAAFADAVRARLANDAAFVPLAVPAIDRRPLCANDGWDHLQTIFPFLLRDPQSGAMLGADRVQQIYRRLQLPDAAVRCLFGQPVACGVRSGVGVSALRLCIGARQVGSERIASVIDAAMAALDRAAWLAGSAVRG